MLAHPLLFASLASAHFVINYPGTRGFNEETHGDWPCGGFDEVSADRSEFPLSGGPIQIHSTHTQQLLEVLVAVGNEPGNNFRTAVVPTFMETGPGDFCFGDVQRPISLNVSEGTNVTFQIISGAADGGLYGCVDVTLTSRTLSQDEWSQHCTNNTNTKLFALEDSSINANESSPSEVQVTSSASSSSSSTPSSENIGHEIYASGMLVLMTFLAMTAALL